MQRTEEIRLSMHEFVSALALCGYDSMARQVINEQELIKNETEFTRFIDETETKLKQKGYWDDNRESNLAKGLEDLLYLLVHSKKKVRCIQMREKQVLLIHSLNNNNALLQRIQTGEHTFSFHHSGDGFYDILRNHYGMANIEINVEGWQPIQMTDEMFDELHTTDPEILHAMKEDENQAIPLREFVSDFLKNGQEFDNISFMVSNYVKDQSEFDEVQFLLPANNYIWHLNYENVEIKKEVVLQPIPVQSYFEEIDKAMKKFLNE
ncbi:hypothetical protein [Oceanobacillus kimchii]|uniref:hypothetical protein n=1 Tax=Oceanobacillus kimchii TaxID=746691 RepID=UPI003C74C318